jgi:hypothetical protein
MTNGLSPKRPAILGKATHISLPPILEQTEIAKGLAGRYVEIYDFFKAPLEVRWQGHLLPYRAFDKEQRVNPAAIVENKRLGHALAVVKEPCVNKRMCQRSWRTARKSGIENSTHSAEGKENAKSKCNANSYN